MGKPNHRERAQLARQRRRERHPKGQASKKVPGCPTPTKTAFADLGAAACEALELSRRSGKQFVPYRCSCGRWHLTGADRALARRGYLRKPRGEGTLPPNAT